MTTTENSFAEEVLRRHWPDQCATAGSTLVQDILSEDVDFGPARDGHFMDVGLAVTTLVSALTFVKLCLEIYILRRDKLGQSPEPAEVRSDIEMRRITVRIPRDKQDAVIVEICSVGATRLK